MIALGQAELRIQLPPNCSHGAIPNHRQRRMDVHARRKALGWLALFIHALIQQPYPDDFG